MLNLLRVEAGKLFRGKAFRITVLVYVISICSTFIPLSYLNALPNLSSLEGMEAVDLEEAEELMETLLTADNFVLDFYRASTGHPMVIMIFLTILILADYGSRTLQGALLCGYSRPQAYLAKLVCGVLGGWAFYAAAMAITTLVGLLFYQMRFDLEMVVSIARLLLVQMAASVQYVAVFTAVAMVLGNGWAFLGSILFFLVVPGIPLLLTLMRGLDYEFATSYLPSFVGVNGLKGFVSLDMMLARPEEWTAGFVLSAALVWLAITVGATLLGMRGFARKQL